MKRAFFICNLRSGRAMLGGYLGRILDLFTAAGWLVSVYSTQCAGDATERAKWACQSGQYEMILCAGGDGTLSETIQGVIASGSGLPIGYIPIGTTNDFAHGLGIPEAPLDAVDAILHGEPMACDVGQFNERTFTYIAAFGAFTNISYDTPQQVKNAIGHTAYILNALASLPKLRPVRMRIAYDQTVIEDEFLYGMVTNSTSVAKILSLREVKWDDGLFEVTLIRKPNNLAELQRIMRSFSSAMPLSDQYLHYFRAGSLTITALDDTPTSWTIDGEYGGESRVNRIENLRQAVTILVDPVRRRRAEEMQHSALKPTIRPAAESLGA